MPAGNLNVSAKSFFPSAEVECFLERKKEKSEILKKTLLKKLSYKDLLDSAHNDNFSFLLKELNFFSFEFPLTLQQFLNSLKKASFKGIKVLMMEKNEFKSKIYVPTLSALEFTIIEEPL